MRRRKHFSGSLGHIFISTGGCLTMMTRTTTMRRYICVLFLFFLIDRPLVGEMTYCVFHHWNTRDAHEKPRKEKKKKEKRTVSVVAPLHLLFLSSSPAVPLIHFPPPLHILPLPPPSSLSILLQICSHSNVYVSCSCGNIASSWLAGNSLYM